MRVLVVEDDRALGLFLQKGLGVAGYDVDLVGDGEAALESARQRKPDLMVLDLGLPRVDGTEVLAQVRRSTPDVSVLVLSGRSDVEERVRCLEAGAHDCVVKPFSFQELVARCTGILRRREQSHASPVLRFGELEMNLIDRSVHRGAQEVELTTKEFALLEHLLRRGVEPSSRAELLSDVWGIAPNTATNIVDVYVNYLRKKLTVSGVETSRKSVIETVRGLGYRLNPALEARTVAVA